MGCEKRPPHEQMQVTEIRIPARNQPISSLRCNYITQATKQVRNADRENNRYCNGNVIEQLHDQLASSIGKWTALSPNYDSTKGCFAYFGCFRGNVPGKGNAWFDPYLLRVAARQLIHGPRLGGAGGEGNVENSSAFSKRQGGQNRHLPSEGQSIFWAQINYLRVPAMVAGPLLGRTVIRHHYDIRPSVARSFDKRPPEARVK